MASLHFGLGLSVPSFFFGWGTPEADDEAAAAADAGSDCLRLPRGLACEQEAHVKFEKHREGLSEQRTNLQRGCELLLGGLRQVELAHGLLHKIDGHQLLWDQRWAHLQKGS